MKNFSPIFIGGCDRSGTTLLGAMLGAHSRAITTPESQFKTEIFSESASNNYSEKMFPLLNALYKHWRFRVWDFVLTEDELNSAAEMSNVRDLMLWLVKTYALRHGQENTDIWVDHTPQNMRTVNTLLHCFPNARFIHIIRDGRAVTNSIIPLMWGPNNVVQAASWWSYHLGFGLAAETFLDRTQIMRVKYEDLVLDPLSTLNIICQFMGVEFERQMLSGGGFKIPEFSKDWHPHAEGEPLSTRVDAWKEALTSRQIEMFEAETADLLDMLGYEKVCGINARESTFWERKKGLFHGYIRRIQNTFRFFRWKRKHLHLSR